MSLSEAGYQLSDFGVYTKPQCRTCGGGLMYEGETCSGLHGTAARSQPGGCPECAGTGSYVPGGPACDACGGTGLAFTCTRRYDPYFTGEERAAGATPYERREARIRADFTQATEELRSRGVLPVANPGAIGAGMYRHAKGIWNG